MDVYQVKETPPTEEVVTVNYTRPKLFHRLLANLVDIFIMLVLFIGLFIGVRAIVQNTGDYEAQMAKQRVLQQESGLYVQNPGNDVSGDLVDIIYYLDTYKSVYGKEFNGESSSGGEPVGKNGLAIRAINQFIAFTKENASSERYNDLLVYYNSARLEPTLNGIHYFEKSGDEIVPTSLADNTNNLSKYYDKIFKPFIEKKCIPFLTANIPAYHEITVMEYKYLLMIELPISYLVAGFLTFFVPPLFFRRGRKTLGKALYHVGLIDERMLSPTLPRFLARFAIFYFLELLISLFSFGIPYIISFSMMVFTKNKQGFPDYMTKLYEVDTSKANIYMDYVEAQLKNKLHGKPIDFEMEKPL